MANASAPSRAPIQIRAFGGLEIDVDGAPLRYGRFPPRKPLALLESLVAINGHTLSAHAACEVLWPEADGFDAYRALITTVYRLRRLLRALTSLRCQPVCRDGAGTPLHLAALA